MSDSLKIFGTTYNNVTGIVASDPLGNELTYTRGGSPTPSGDSKMVYFIDYDGTVLYSYTTVEFAELSALPGNPTHTGLTAQGWNWTLSQIKAQLTAVPNGEVWVGQMYITDSENTEIDITLVNNYLSPYLATNVNGTIVIDWGDNSSTDTVTGTSLNTILYTQHTYSTNGNYTISIKVTNGTFRFYNNSPSTDNSPSILKESSNRLKSKLYSNNITAIRLGKDISISRGSFSNLKQCKYITIPKTITGLESQAFYACSLLNSLTIPNDITVIPEYCFCNNRGIKNISLPSTITLIDNYAFSQVTALSSLTLPNGLKTINQYSFQNTGLILIEMPDTVTTLNSYGFNNSQALITLKISNGLTTISSSSIYAAYSLVNVTIPNTITSIGSYAFYNNYSLLSLIIPNSVTSLDSNAFQNCASMREYHFLGTTPPTLANTNVFTNIPNDCIIYVPYSADHSVLNAYQTATNWSTYASKIQEEPQ